MTESSGLQVIKSSKPSHDFDWGHVCLVTWCHMVHLSYQSSRFFACDEVNHLQLVSIKPEVNQWIIWKELLCRTRLPEVNHFVLLNPMKRMTDIHSEIKHFTLWLVVNYKMKWIILVNSMKWITLNCVFTRRDEETALNFVLLDETKQVTLVHLKWITLQFVLLDLKQITLNFETCFFFFLLTWLPFSSLRQSESSWAK